MFDKFLKWIGIRVDINAAHWIPRFKVGKTFSTGYGLNKREYVYVKFKKNTPQQMPGRVKGRGNE